MKATVTTKEHGERLINVARFDNKLLPADIVNRARQYQEAIIAFRDERVKELQQDIERYYGALENPQRVASPQRPATDELGKTTTMQDVLKKTYSVENIAASGDVVERDTWSPLS